MAAVKVFWDTNILLDFIDRRVHELDATDAIYELAISRQLHLTVSESVVCTALYLSDIRRPDVAISTFIKSADVLPCSNSIILTGLLSSFKNKEDAILYHLALHHRIDAFITRDKKDYRPYALPQLPILSPKEFMKQFY